MRKHRIQQFLGSILALGLVLVMSLPSTAAHAASSTSSSLVNNFYFKEFTADYYLTREEDGSSTLLVVEELMAYFPYANQNHGITRQIPFTNNGGKNLTMNPDKLYIDVQRNGKDEPIDNIVKMDNYFDVYIGNANTYVQGDQKYTLTYEFTNVIMDFDDWQELYWDTNGTGWQQRFDKVTARVHLDADLRDQFTGKTSCYVGKFGSNDSNRCSVSTLSDGVQFSASNLSAYENLTLDMQFAADTFAVAPIHYSYLLVVILVFVIIFGIVMVAIMLACWRATAENRKYYKDKFVKPEYAPPTDMTVAQMAENYVETNASGDRRVATLLELAVHHKIELVKTEVPGAFGKTKTEWRIRVKSDKLKQEQAVVLKILNGKDAPLHVGQEIVVKNRMTTQDMNKLGVKFVELVKKALMRKGLQEYSEKKHYQEEHGSLAGYQKPKGNIVTWIIVGEVLWFVIGFLVIAASFDMEPSYYYLIGGEDLFGLGIRLGILHLVIIALIVGVFVAATIVGLKCQKVALHTKKGLDYSRHMEGLRLYVEMAEAERLKMLQSVDGADTTHEGVVKIYEKLLPYAAVFNLEKSWLDELGRYYAFDDVGAPTWYVGVGHFSAHEFSSAMTSASRSMSSAISSSTSSSSGSGGGGGGFSGGGGGGGGGGGW